MRCAYIYYYHFYLHSNQMLYVLKPNCYIYTRHDINSGVKENYLGIHCWNLHIENNDLMLSNKDFVDNYNLSHMFYDVEIELSLMENNMFVAIFKKIGG